MSRDALVTLRWQSDHDKTRVSSINKRRVISVPEEGAASAEAGASGLGRSGAPIEVWTRRSPRVARPRSWAPFRSVWSYPTCTPSAWEGLCLSGCRRSAWIAVRAPLRRGPDCPPTIAVPRGADPGGPLPSGPVPAPSLLWQRSTASSAAGVAPRASIACESTLALSPRLTSCFELLLARRTTMQSPSTSPSRPCARAHFRESLDDPCEGSETAVRRSSNRVADVSGGSGRSRSPAFPSSSRSRRRREINRPRPQ